MVRDFAGFCRSLDLHGGINLTGGNPLLHPRFLDLFAAIDRLGLSMSILGNPVARDRLEELASIQAPVFYQLSLEGLAPQNDRVRGAGHFGRVMACLEDLRSLGIRSHVMLTLTSENVAQVLPLASLLRGLTDSFTFTRLVPVGNGTVLKPPDRETFLSFLREYLDAARFDPMLGTKDNLFNLLRYERGEPLGRGCSGAGCSLAFDSLVLLPDGEVHACRKFPSPIGNIRTASFDRLYFSEVAERYRLGPAACRSCALFSVCGGCPAANYLDGRVSFDEPDPYCFIGTLDRSLHIDRGSPSA